MTARAARHGSQPAPGSPADVLHRHSLRATESRIAVLSALARLGGHPRADEVAAAIGPSVHRATVYRVLETLLDLGVVTHVHLPSGAVAYHLADESETQPHLHARCHDCGAVIDLPAGLLDPVAAQVARDVGFVIDPSHIALSGHCRDCLSADPAAHRT